MIYLLKIRQHKSSKEKHDETLINQYIDAIE
jgi:hypothetical protein